MHAFCLLILSLFFCSSLVAQTVEPKTGRLIVSYHTDSQGERLERIRFLLINEKQEHQMYPKAQSIIKAQATPSCHVVIENLPIGTYSLRFLVPNSDGLFENIPERKIVVATNSETNINQAISYATTNSPTPNQDSSSSEAFGTLILVVQLKEPLQSGNEVKFKIIDSHGKERLLPLHEEEASAHPNKEHLILIQELPVGNYQLVLDPSTPIENFTINRQQTTVLHHSYSNPNEVANVIRHKRVWGINPAPLVIYNVNGFLTVNSNIPDSHWTLFKDNIRIFSGAGSVLSLPVQAGSNYRIQAEPIEGYTVRVFPPFTFSVNGGETIGVDITYQRTYGYLNIKTNFPDPNGFDIIIRPPEGQTLQFSVKSKDGKISWQSPPLPTGIYEVQYGLPDTFQTMPPQLIRVQRGEHVILRPRFVGAGILRLTANIPEAIYILRKSDNSQAWRGGGSEFIFKELKAGSYILTFTSENPGIFIPPDEMQFTLSDFENKEINTAYHLAGSLIIHANIDKSTVNIKNLNGLGQTLKEEINRTKTLTLPEGRYRLVFESPKNGKESKPPEPIDVEIQPFRTQEINATFTFKEVPEITEKYTQLIIASNISEAGFIIQKITDSSKESIGHFNGKSVAVPLSPSQNYEIVFDNVPNYKEPDIEIVNLAAGEQKTIQVTYIPARQTKFVPQGRAIIGDPNPDPTNARPAKTVEISSFSIGVYEVTNAQFAAWLNEALKERNIVYVEEADNRGQVLDLAGRLICKTFEGDPYSQISAQTHSLNKPSFIPMPGKDSYPVINVSWYGAAAYCKDNNCRLPTEAEWEKAASMAPEKPGEPLKKFRFGFGRDTIDKTWANYKDESRTIDYFQVLTTPVGYYNGINLLPLSFASKGQEKTNLAVSPYGAFDMSGNVWEWVSDWYDSDYSKNMTDKDPQGPSNGTEKIVKGGCYDSLEDGVRVFERLGLSPNHTDAFTGFRIAVDVF